MRQCSRKTPSVSCDTVGTSRVLAWTAPRGSMITIGSFQTLPCAKESIYSRLRNLKSVGPPADQPSAGIRASNDRPTTTGWFSLLSHMTAYRELPLTGIVRKNGKMLVTLPITVFRLSLSVHISRRRPVGTIDASDMTSRWRAWTNH